MPDLDALLSTSEGDAASAKTAAIVHAYLTAVGIIVADTSRDPSFGANYLLWYLAQDLIEPAALATNYRLTFYSLKDTLVAISAKGEWRLVAFTSEGAPTR